MTLPALTWSSLLAHYSAPAWQPLVSLARTYYAQQGQLLTAAQYLAQSPTAAAVPFVESPAALQFIAAALPAYTPEVPATYTDYAARGTAQTQPVLRALGDALRTQGIAPADLQAGVHDQEASQYLAQVLTPAAWAIIAAAAQQQAQYTLDEEGRSARLQARFPALAALHGRALAALPGVSLEALLALPSNELARALWVPGPVADDLFINELAGALQAAAQGVLAANYPEADQADRLLALLDPTLRGVAQAVLAPAEAPLLRVAELAAAPGEVAARLAALPANHPVVYALAAALQTAGHQFLLAETPAAPELPAPVATTYSLLGAERTPLAGFTLVLTQDDTDPVSPIASLPYAAEPAVNARVAAPTGDEVPADPIKQPYPVGGRPLGTILTDDTGSFVLRVAPPAYLTADDTVALAPLYVRAALYRPGQDPAGVPLLTLTLTPATAGDATTLYLDVPAAAPDATPDSVPVLALDEDLTPALRDALAATGITTLADVRAAGGLQTLFADLLASLDEADAHTQAQARRLDALARFEVVAPDATFNSQVVAAGFDSPDELLATATPEEFVQRLGLAQAPAEARTQALGFYEQVAATQSLSQALGLLLAGARASGTVPPADEPGPIAGVLRSGLAAMAEASPAEANEASSADPDGAASAQRQIPGLSVTPGFNLPPAARALSYDSSQQCDCPACRSAVSPTAYLAALLAYATTNLRPVVPAGSPASPSVTLLALQTKFSQPFADLRLSCQAAEEPVCQYRLAIEVIQSYARANKKGALTIEQARPYVEGVLDALLQALGTSLAELRAATTDQLPALATRLAVPLATLTALRADFSVAQLAGTNSLTDLETKLEQHFGLVSTAREPLDGGLVLDPTTAGPVKLLHWSLQGVAWGLNTSPNGSLYLEVTRSAAAPAAMAVVVYRESLDANEQAKVEDNVVARGDLRLLDAANPAQGYAGLLYPQYDSGLSGAVRVAAPAAYTGSTTFKLAALPAVTAGQQQAQLAGWLSQDAAALDPLRAPDGTTWNGFKFLLDPDLLGPDDFRPGPANPAYRLWRQRYTFLQDDLIQQLLPDGAPLTGRRLGYLLDNLTSAKVTYPGSGASWAGTIWRSTFLFTKLTGTALLAALHATQAGARALGLPAEGVERLYALWQLSLTKDLADDDLQEALDLVRQSAKTTLAATWDQEEQATGLAVLALDNFQPALHEPLPGPWAPTAPGATTLPATQLPRLDPDEVTPLALPDTGLGDAAATLWVARQAELLRKRQALLASGTTVATPAGRVDAMLAYAYRPDPATPTTGLPGAAPFASLALLSAAYLNDADPKHQAALTYMAGPLALRPAEAERLLALAAQAPAQPTELLWQELAALFTLGWKRAVAYRQAYVPEGSTSVGLSWLTQETQAFAGTPLDYLIGTRKHHLVQWRATSEARTAWAQALDRLAERPLIDPDQLVPGDFRQAGERSRVLYSPPLASPFDYPFLNPAYNLFHQREGQVAQWLATVKQAWPAAGPVAQWAYVASQLGSTPTELQELSRQLAANVDVRAALRRLGLPAAGLALLAAQIADPAATDRLAEVYHLLVQVRRARAYAAWALEERALGLALCPLYFRQPVAEAESLATLPWRSSATARRQWQRTLSARYDQAAALVAARQQAVRSAEDQYLILLREALITNHVTPNLTGFDSKADWLNNEYLLDFKTACCQHTTRVAQSIEVLQKLFMNLRGGLASSQLTLANTATTFEADWQWLGSYERWRSLLFLYLYPQNVLLPALKPGQSAQYRQTVQDIRQAATLSPAAARDYLLAYQTYLNDLSTLQLAAATETTLAPVSPDGFQASTGSQTISVQAALSADHRAYANIFSLSNPAADTNYNWTRLPGAALVERVIGSTLYQPQDGERYVYVFVLLRDDQKNTLATAVPVTLAFQRLNLRTLQWEADFTQLALKDSETLDASSLRVLNGTCETWAPVVVGLRNRRALLYTDYPFSQQPLKPPGGTTDTGSQLVLSRVLAIAANQYNVDLFFVVLDAAGKGIGLEQNRTIFCCQDARLLSGVQAKRDTITVCTALTVGSEDTGTSFLSIFRIQLTDYGSQVRYLIPGDFTKAGAFDVKEDGDYYLVQFINSDGRTLGVYKRERYYTTLFTTARFSGSTTSKNNDDPYGIRLYFKPIIDNIKAFLDGTDDVRRANKVAIEARAETLYTTQTSGGGGFYPPTTTVLPLRVPLATKNISTATGVRVLPQGTLNQAGELGNYILEVYYKALNRLLPPGGGSGYIYFYDTYCLSFYVTGGGADFRAQRPVPYVSPDVNALQLQPLGFIGPALRSAPASTATLGTAYVAPTGLVQAKEADIFHPGMPAGTLTASGTTYLLSKILPSLPPLFSSLSPTDQASRRQLLADIHAATPLGTPSFVNTLVSEAYYALPLLLAQELMRSRNYELALHYFRLVYDYTQLAAPTAATPDPKRLVYPALLTTGVASYAQDKVLGWLQNPNNPYTLAALRPDAHLQYVVMSVVRCLLAYADTEFTTDTAESVPRARSLYELAARLLKQDITQYVVADTASLLDPFDAQVPADWRPEWLALKGVLARVNQRHVLDQVLTKAPTSDFTGATGPGLRWLFAQAQAGRIPWDATFDQAWLLVNGQLASLSLGYLTLSAAQDAALAPRPAGSPTLPTGTARPYVPFLAANFCVPTNPVPFALALQAELNLFKIRSCRNIAGIQRELEPYAAATDNTTGLPTLNANGQLSRSARLVVPATQYRYAFIIERARQLVALAQQTESTLLSALEKRDAEAYNLLKARQDIAVSQATVQLQTLRVTEAEDGVDLANLQLEKVELTEEHFKELLDGGLNEWEIAQMVAIGVAGAAKALAATAKGISPFALLTGTENPVAAAFSAIAAIADATASIDGLRAGYERREQDWQYQRTLAQKDIQLSKQSIKIAGDQVRITGQEKRISQLQLDHGQAVLDFLTTKFTNAELYDWMSRILETAYGYFLQQATATARLAEQQLAFERQQVPAGIVQADYYSDPADDATTSAGLTTGTASTSTSRKGLTGSVRLLQDLTRLDEYAFETNRRKLQLSKTISLAQSFPTEFVRFRETGVVNFACQPEWFDQDFPGQYLRVLRRVRTSVIALVPPVEGIKARLSTAGTSHVTVDGTPFQTLALPRAQEMVALTSPINATGLYELDTQNELLLPFEGLGVDVPWQFAMQPASNPGLDYSAVADVLITLDYSALDSADYARQVVQQLGTARRQVVALSLRDRFADQWYDLHHADELEPADQYRVRLPLTAADLPRHLRGATVSQVSLYVDAPLDDATDPTAPSPAFTDRSQLELRLTRGAGVGGAAFTNQYGLISTRTGVGAGPLYTGNAVALLPLKGTTPAGEWVLSIAPGRLRERLAAGLVNDIYLILEVEGDAPNYTL